jgi:hypothetical protein
MKRALALSLALVAFSGCGGSESDTSDDASGGAGGGPAPIIGGSAPDGGAGNVGAGSDGGSTSSGPPAQPDCSERPSAAPSAAWENVTGNLANMPSECGNLTIVVATPCSPQVVAGVALKGLWHTTNGGESWEALGSGDGSAVVTNRPSSIVHDPEHPDAFWLSGIYNGAGVYKSDDVGVTFEQLGEISHNDLVSVDFTDPERMTLLAGGHEQKQMLHRSTDGGQTWTNVGANLPGNSHFSSYPLVIDSETHLVGTCGWGDGTCGIWRTTDGGATWGQASDLPAQAAPLWASDGAIYWPLGDGTLAKSTDGGESFSKLSTSLALVTPVELPDGRLVSMREGKLAITADGGQSWSPIGEPLPFQPAGLTYSAATLSFYVWHWDCGGVVLSDAIQRAGFDYRSPD